MQRNGRRSGAVRIPNRKTYSTWMRKKKQSLCLGWGLVLLGPKHSISSERHRAFSRLGIHTRLCHSQKMAASIAARGARALASVAASSSSSSSSCLSSGARGLVRRGYVHSLVAAHEKSFTAYSTARRESICGERNGRVGLLVSSCVELSQPPLRRLQQGGVALVGYAFHEELLAFLCMILVSHVYFALNFAWHLLSSQRCSFAPVRKPALAVS